MTKFKVNNILMGKNFLFILISITVLFGCKKETSSPPVVEITEPYSGQQFVQGDTIFYKFSVSDDEAVTNVKVSIYNHQNQIVLSHNYINAGIKKDYSGFFLTESFAILGTTHHFVVSATDGENETRSGKELIIFQSEVKTLAVLIVTADNLFNYEISSIDSVYNQQMLINTNGDFLDLEINSKDQIFYHSGKFVGDLYASNINGGVYWSEPANSVAGNPAFHEIHFQDGLLFVSYDNEIIKAYDKNKSVKFTANTGTSNYAKKIIKSEDIVLTEQYSYPYIETNLVSYYFGSGSSIKSKSIGQIKVNEIYKTGNDEFIILGNINGNGKILLYNFILNSISEPYQLASGDSIVTSVQLPSGNSLILQLVSGLYEYNYVNNSLLPLLPAVNFEILAHDNVNSLLITSNGNILNYYSYPQLQLINSITTSMAVKDIEILYSR